MREPRMPAGGGVPHGPHDDDPEPDAGTDEPDGRLLPASLVGRLDRWAPMVELGLLVVAVVGGLVARLWPSTPLWLDEALSVNIARQPLGDIGDRLRHDGHPPLYYWLLHGWMNLFGTSDAAVRSFSVLCGVAAVALTWVVVRRLAGPAVAVAAVILSAASPYAIRYGSETRMYALVMVLVLLGWWLLEEAWAAPSGRQLVGVAVVSGLLLLTHYWAIFLLGTLGLVLLARARFAADASSRFAARRLVVAVAAGGLLFVPWIGAFVYQRRHTGTPWAPASRPTRVLSETLADFSGGIDPEATLLLVLLAVLLVLGVWGRRRGRTVALGTCAPGWVRRVALVAAGTLAVGAAASWAGHSAFAGRYAAVVFPLVVALAAVGVDRLGAPWLRTSVLALAVLFGFVVAGLAAVKHDRTEAGAIAAVIEEQGARGDVVVVCPDQLGPGLERELHGRGFDVVSYPDLGDPRFVDWVDYAARHDGVDPAAVADRLIARTPPAGTLWVVWNSSYRVIETQCDDLVTSVIARRPASATVLAADPAKYFENASLLAARPAAR